MSEPNKEYSSDFTEETYQKSAYELAHKERVHCNEAYLMSLGLLQWKPTPVPNIVIRKKVIGIAKIWCW
jgi:hypothetical protein